MVKKIITNLDSSEGSGRDYIPVLILKSCEPELSYILAEIYFWRNLLFQIVGKSHCCSLYLRMLRKCLLLKTTALLIFFLWLVKYLLFVNNKNVDHLEKCGLFTHFHYVFRSSWSIVDHLIVVSDRITRAFNRSGATQAVALDISKAFDRIWHTSLFQKLTSYGISGQIFLLSH